ncbi:TlyA family RNA methyltransferase [Gordonia phthalatica]|uniref:Cytochrome C peroxidase n=1 Tax=Gordonia phthalatica TaxID=1136941 RepID=A0A0N9MVS2_9ACTN|nr:TlyA family RNA methyltransferase [Gordonia phthalatica]ALG86830.1 cytochrome C peroxidase [Gordonia phthalatica]
MAARARLDAELVRRGLARSREQAREYIDSGFVKVNGAVATKAATNVAKDTPLVVSEPDTDHWASRGAHKLLGALEAFEPQGVSVDGKRCLDAGASTGGFTDVLLRRGAREVEAVDVGYGQLVWKLQSDDRVHIHDRTNVRHLTPETIGGPVDLIVGDLSFISLKLVLPALASCLRPGGDALPMVKPQFEVGKDRVGHGGVVRDPDLRADAVEAVAAMAASLGLQTRDVVASPLPGPSGNVEFFLWLHRPLDSETDDAPDEQTSAAGDTVDGETAARWKDPEEGRRVRALIDRAVADGPQ